MNIKYYNSYLFCKSDPTQVLLIPDAAPITKTTSPVNIGSLPPLVPLVNLACSSSQYSIYIYISKYFGDLKLGIFLEPLPVQ